MTDPIETMQLRIHRGDRGAACIDRNASTGPLLASLVPMLRIPHPDRNVVLAFTGNRAAVDRNRRPLEVPEVARA